MTDQQPQPQPQPAVTASEPIPIATATKKHSHRRRSSSNGGDGDVLNVSDGTGVAVIASPHKKKAKKLSPETKDEPISCSAPSAGFIVTPPQKKEISRDDFQVLRLLGKGDVGRVYAC